MWMQISWWRHGEYLLFVIYEHPADWLGGDNYHVNCWLQSTSGDFYYSG